MAHNRFKTLFGTALLAAMAMFWIAQSACSQSTDTQAETSQASAIRSSVDVDERIFPELRYHFLKSHATEEELQAAKELLYLCENNGIPPENIALLILFHIEKGVTPGDSLRLAEEEIIRAILVKHASPQSSDNLFAFDPVAFLQNVEGFIGTPYQWGGESRRGTDCSGFSWNIMNGMGVPIPRMKAIDYFHSSDFTVVDRNSLQPGDLVFFYGRNRGAVNHVGIYLGNDKFAHASRGAGRVKISNLNSLYWVRHWAGARRHL